MKDIARPLIKDEQIRQFLDAIDFEAYFSDKDNQTYAFPGMTDIDGMMGTAITLIKQANKDLVKVLKYNTQKSQKYRSLPYKTSKQRDKLHKIILSELTSQVRPVNDDAIRLGFGGMLPRTGEVRYEKKAIILIGLPASGKSGVASKISDYYGAVLIDSDFVKRKIPEFVSCNGASLVHTESKFINDKIKNDAIIQGVNIVLPVIGSDYENVLGMIRNLEECDYKVSLVLVELDRVKATQRAFSRFMHTNRYIPLSMILDVYSNSPSLVFYKLLSNNLLSDNGLSNMPMVLIDSDVPYGQKQKIIIERNFSEIHKII